jgi:hypothetical protein
MKKMIFPLTIGLLAACASKTPQKMSGRERAKCAWNGNAACKTELQHRMQMRQSSTSTTGSGQAG